jgi:undecaprenyl pyrophosphate synthase
MCINYGGQVEIVDAVNRIIAERTNAQAGARSKEQGANVSSQYSVVGSQNSGIQSGGANGVSVGSIRDGSKVSVKNFRKYLYQPKMRDVDLLIRTGGQMRISNFLLFEIAYAELYFDSKMWPDYNRQDLWKAIQEFSQHQRTYGK